jgi:hypothetical protein
MRVHHGGERLTDVIDNVDIAIVWRDATAVLAAEQALEFWANNCAGQYDGDNEDDGVNNRRGNRRDRQYGRQGNGRRNNHLIRSTTMDDAKMALRLFAAIHHFHLFANNKDIYCHDSCGGGRRRPRDGRDAVLANGMYLHVVDTLARSTTPEHLHLANALMAVHLALRGTP